MTLPHIDYSLASAGHQINAHADIYTRRRKQSVTHISGRQFFGMEVRGVRTSLQDDTEDRYDLDGRVILNFGKQFYKLKSIVCAKPSIARVQLTPEEQANDGRCAGPPPDGVLWYSLSSLDTYSTLEGDFPVHISRGKYSVDN